MDHSRTRASRPLLVSAIIVIVCCVGLEACGDSAANPATPDTGTMPSGSGRLDGGSSERPFSTSRTARLRFLNARPGVGNIDIYSTTGNVPTRVVEGLPYATVSPYVQFPVSSASETPTSVVLQGEDPSVGDLWSIRMQEGTQGTVIIKPTELQRIPEIPGPAADGRQFRISFFNQGPYYWALVAGATTMCEIYDSQVAMLEPGPIEIQQRTSLQRCGTEFVESATFEATAGSQWIVAAMGTSAADALLLAFQAVFP